MFNPLLERYRQYRKELLVKGFVWQTGLALIFAVVYTLLNEHLPHIGVASILLLLFNIPTVAIFVIRRFERFETEEWRQVLPGWDFTGTWNYTAEYDMKIENPHLDAAICEHLKAHFQKKESGSVIIEQTISNISVKEGLGAADKKMLCEWQSIAADYDSVTEGFICVFRDTSCFPSNIACSATIEGVEHVRVIRRDSRGRPMELSSHYSSCKLCDTHIVPFSFTAKAHYQRTPSL
jgi:hypothetical protein